MSIASFSKTIVAAALVFSAIGATASFAGEALPETCVVNGDKFSEHNNPPVKVSHEGESISVCCKKCARKFEKSPEKYIKAYREELAKEGKSKAQAAK